MKQEKSKIIEAINTPLGFFALALLIIEGFLGIVLIFAKTPKDSNLSFYGMWIGASLFVIVVIAVTILTWFKADDLGLAGKDRVDIRKKELDNSTKTTEYIDNPKDGSKEDQDQEKYNISHCGYTHRKVLKLRITRSIFRIRILNFSTFP